MAGARVLRSGLGLIVTIAVLAGCDLPRDAHGTLDRVRNGKMRVGIAENVPWTGVEDGNVFGVETVLVEAFADELESDVIWIRGTVPELLARLERFELDLVIAGLTEQSPGLARVASSRPYLPADATGSTSEARRIVALPPGENALLFALDRFLQSHLVQGDRVRTSSWLAGGRG